MADASTGPAGGRLPRSVRIGYAAGSLSTGAFTTVPGLLLLPYLTDTIGLGAALAGLLVLLPKAWDVLLNPIAGRISDRTEDPRGPRRPFLLWGGIALSGLFAAMFAHPVDDTLAAAAWVVVLFLLAATAYAFYQVPYVALPAEITDDPAERTRLMTLRIAVLAIAILAAGAGAPAIRDAFGAGPFGDVLPAAMVPGYRVMGIAIGVLILLGALWAYFGTARAPVGRSRPSASSWRETVRAVKAAPRFARLLVVFVVQAVGIGTMLAGVDYVARTVLGSSGMSSVLFASFVGPALLVMPAWQWAARRFAKVVCYVAASLMFAAGAIGVAVLALTAPVARRDLSIVAGGAGEASFGWAAYVPLDEAGSTALGPPTVVVVACVVLIGIGYAGQQVFPLSLLADLSAEAEEVSGGKRAGIFAGVWTAGETFGMALGPGIYGLVLASGGYVSASVSGVQPTSAIVAAIVGFTLVPVLFVLIPLPLLRRVDSGGAAVS